MLDIPAYLNIGHLAAPHTPEKRFPGVRGKLKKDVNGILLASPSAKSNNIENQENQEDIIPVKLKKNTKVIIQPLNPDQIEEKQQFKITLFKKAKSLNSELPEAQRDITTGESYFVELDEPEKYLNFNDEHYQKSELPLFQDGSPQLSDIEQFRTPNCFLLAAIQAILNHPNGQAYIRGMMLQNDDGTTTVRLFDPRTKQPIYVRVENSYLVAWHGSLNWHAALWVHILEKAYLTLGLKTKEGKFLNVDESSSSVYSGGGPTELAMKILTGTDNNYIPLAVSNIPYLPTFFDETIEEHFTSEDYAIFNEPLILKFISGAVTLKPERMKQLDLLRIILEGPYTEDDSRERVVNDALTQKQYDALSAYVHLKFIFKQKPDDFAKIIAEKLPLNQQIQKLKTAFASDLDEEAINTLDRILQYQNQVPENTSSFEGAYFKDEYDHFIQIKEALAQGKLITAGTLDKFDGKVPGIKPNHAYTVLDVVEKEITFKDVEGNITTKTVYLLELRNPWGRVGRVHDIHKDSREVVISQELSADVFKVELKDFHKYFHGYTVSHDSLTEDNYNSLKEKWLDYVSDLAIQGDNISYQDAKSLGKVNAAYQNGLDQLIELELSELKHIKNIDEIYAILNDVSLTEDEKFNAVFNLIDLKKFKYFDISELNLKNYVFDLIKYQWHRENNNMPTDFYNQFADKVSQRAMQYEPWEKLVNQKSLAEVISNQYEKKAAELFEKFTDLCHEISSSVDLLPDLNEVMEKKIQTQVYIEQLISNKLILIAYQVELQKLVSKLKEISSKDRDELDSSLEKFNEAVQLVDEKVRRLAEFQDIQIKLPKAIESLLSAISDYHGVEIKKDEVITLIQQFKLQPTRYYSKLSEMGAEYKKSEDTKVREIGEQMSTLARLGRQLKELYILIKEGFSRIINSFRNTYNVPPSPKEELQKERVVENRGRPVLGG